MRRVGIWLAALASVVSVGAAGIAALRSRPLDDALRKAAHADDGRLVRLLLHRGADPQTEDVSHVSLVDWALGENKPDIAAALLEAGARTDVPFMLLHAAENNDSEIIRILLDHHGDPNLTNRQGKSLLHLAAQHQNAYVVRMLVEDHANPNVHDRGGRTPLMDAAFSTTDSMVDTDPEQILLEHGAEVNAQADDGTTALTEALRSSKVGTVRLLLRFRANPNLARKDGQSPLLIAVQSPDFNSNVVRALLQAGARPDVADTHGRSAMSVARKQRRAGLVKLLTEPLHAQPPPANR